MILWSVSNIGKRVSLLGVLAMAVSLLTGTLANAQAATAPATSTATKKAIQGAQERLRALGYEPGSTDGVMGAKTGATLKKFQSDHGLPATGKLDSKTTGALSEGIVEAKSSTPAASPATPAEAGRVAPAISSPLKLTVENTEVGTEFSAFLLVF